MDDATLARFMGKVEIQPNGCWHWTKFVHRGYGMFWLEGAHRRAHRVSYEHFKEPIPAGLDVDHICHNQDLSCPGGMTCPHRRCVRPDHLEAVPCRTNLLRGRTLAAANVAKDRCPYKHEYTPENTYIPPGGGRQCKACHRRQNRLNTRRRRAAARAARMAAAVPDRTPGSPLTLF